MSKKSPGRGRPKVYTGQLAKHIGRLVRDHGLSDALCILAADAKKTVYVTIGATEYEIPRSWAALRSSSLVPKPMKISMPTLRKLASEAGVGELKRGRPAA